MRRPNGTGTIVKLSGSRRNPYAVRIPARDQRGRVVQKYLSYHHSAAEAQQALDAYNAHREVQVPPDKLAVTLGQVYALWSKRVYPKAGRSVQGKYKASWKRLSRFSEKAIRNITLDDLQGIIDEDETNNKSQALINDDKQLMNQIFRFAMERDIIIKDYSIYVKVPHVDPKKKKGAFNDLQMKRLEQMAAAGRPWADTVLMLCYTGFRITAFLELTRFSYHADGNYLQGGIKTDAGKNRIVPVHPKIKPYLDKWLEKGGDAIICDEAGRQISSAQYRKYFKEIALELNEPDATPHWCRHTFSTRLHAAGVPELEQKRLMGHADKNITEHYTHTDIEQLTKAIHMLA